MSETFERRTDRLLLRRWRPDDRAPFAEMNADPRVMEHFPATMTREESDTMVDRIEQNFDRGGYGPWALEVAETGAFIGFTGLIAQTFEAHFTPAVEVGWRLAVHAWGHGYATEAAQASLAYGFDRLGLEEIVSMTIPANTRSQAVMRRIGMIRDPADDFDHPRMKADARMRRHVLYRIGAARWRELQAG